MMFLCIECGENSDENRFYRKVENKCKDCFIKKFKCELCEKSFIKKWLTTHFEREHPNVTITIEHYWSVLVFQVKHN